MSMTREEAIRFLERYVGNLYYTPQCQAAHRMAIEALKGQEERRWIPVTERWPDLIPCGAGTGYSEAVNVLTDGRKVLTAIWNGSYWVCDAEFWDAEFEEITHWTPVLLPLPQPPKGE